MSVKSKQFVPMVGRYRNGWWLEQKYWGEELTQAEIADECGVSARLIRKYMKRFGIETRDVEGSNHGLKGKRRSDEVRRKISEALEDRDVSAETRDRMVEAPLGNELSETTKSKISEALSDVPKSHETRRKMSESRTGEGNPNWSGGHAANYGPGWTRVKQAVRERDQQCQQCGCGPKDSRRLDVHHVIPVRIFASDPERREQEAHHELNCILLCRSCHMAVEHAKTGLRRPTGKPTRK